MPAITPQHARRPPVFLRRRYRLRLAALVCLVAFTSACAAAQSWVQTSPDLAARARRDPLSFVDAAYARWHDQRGMVGSYQVRASRGINSRTIDTQIYLLRDDLVDIQVLLPTGQTEGQVLVGREEVALWVADENVYYVGDNQPGAFGRALGIDLSAADVVAVLMGFGVVRDGNETVVWDEPQRRIRVRNHGVTAWLHPALGVFDRVVVHTEAGPIEVDYQRWADDAPIPLNLRIHVASEEITLDLRLAPRWDINPVGLDERYFETFVPRGARLESLARLSIDGGLLRRGLDR